MYIYTYRDIYRYIGINRDNLIVLSCLPSSEKHLPAGNGNKYWDPHVDNVQRVKTSLLRGLSPSNPSSGAQDTLPNRRQKDGENQRRWRIPRTRSPSKHSGIDTHMNSDSGSMDRVYTVGDRQGLWHETGSGYMPYP